MTTLLYQNNSHLTEFSATVLSCTEEKAGFAVLLDATAFYPEGGGQPADHGILGTAQVLDVRERDGIVTHYTDAPLPVGETVSGQIDFARRFDLMQQHSGEHIVSGLIHEAFGYNNVGFHLGSEMVTIDLDGELTAAQLAAIELAANEVVFANAEVALSYPDAAALATLDYRSKKPIEGQVRIVTIPGGDVCACCGTHVARTGEIGLIKFCGMQSYKGGVRIAMLSGRRAVEFAMREHAQVAAISALLSAKQPEIVPAVERLVAAEATERSRANRAITELTAQQVAAHAGKTAPLLFLEERTPDELRRAALALIEQGADRAGVFSGAESSYKYALSGADPDETRRFGKAMNDALCGRGGGKAGLIQGSVTATRAAIEKFFAAQIG